MNQIKQATSQLTRILLCPDTKTSPIYTFLYNLANPEETFQAPSLKNGLDLTVSQDGLYNQNRNSSKWVQFYLLYLLLKL